MPTDKNTELDRTKEKFFLSTKIGALPPHSFVTGNWKNSLIRLSHIFFDDMEKRNFELIRNAQAMNKILYLC